MSIAGARKMMKIKVAPKIPATFLESEAVSRREERAKTIVKGSCIVTGAV